MEVFFEEGSWWVCFGFCLLGVVLPGVNFNKII